MNVATVQLPDPAIANFDLPVAGGGAVADDEMVGQSVGHAADVAMVVVENARVALPGAAIVNDDVFPAVARDACVVDRLTDRRGQVVPLDASTPGSGNQISLIFGPGFLDNNRIIIVSTTEKEPVMFAFGSRRWDRSRWLERD